MSADQFNAAMEFVGALFVLYNCRATYRDRAVKGVTVASTMFFMSWGAWNVYYYPSLGQWWSFGGAVAMLVANLLWIALMLRYAPRLRAKAAAREISLVSDKGGFRPSVLPRMDEHLLRIPTPVHGPHARRRPPLSVVRNA